MSAPETELPACCRMGQLLPLQQHQNHSCRDPLNFDCVQLLLDKAFFVSNTIFFFFFYCRYETELADSAAVAVMCSEPACRTRASGVKEARITLSLTVREILAESDRGMMRDIFSFTVAELVTCSLGP